MSPIEYKNNSEKLIPCPIDLELNVVKPSHPAYTTH
jgi:hypothetical protein